MGKKSDRFGVVFSTNDDYDFDYSNDEQGDLEQAEQKLRVWHDSKGRKGKTATIVKGFVGSDETLKDLCKLIKSKCGVGGSVKDGEIIIQGAIKERVKDILIKEGYTQTKSAGG